MTDTSDQEVTESPVLFAEWVYTNIVSMISEEEKQAFLATIPEDRRKELSITVEEQKAWVDELLVMLGLGACMFSSLNLSYDNHQAFKRAMSQQVAKQLFGANIESRVAEIEKVFEQYLEVLVDKSKRAHMFSGFSEIYFDRVFPSNPNKSAMFMGAEIAKIPLDTALASFELTRDGFFRLRHGMSYANYLATQTALDDTN